jgi:MFS superfamily sulfate permease-like transporter
MSLIVTSLMVLMVLLFFTGPLAYMPDAVLSAVVFLIGINLIDIRGMRKIYQQWRSEFWVAVLTMLVVAFVGVEQGIMLAVVLSLIDHIRHGYKPKNAVLVPGASGIMRAQPVASKAEAEPGLMIYRFTHSIYYANAQLLTEEITGLVNTAEPPLRWFCIDASAIDDVDYSAAESLRSILGILKDKGVRLVVAQVMDDVREGGRYALHELIGEDAFYDSLDEVVEAYRQQTAAN